MLFENYISQELFVLTWKFYKRDENHAKPPPATRVNDGCNVPPKNSKHISSERSVFQTLFPHTGNSWFKQSLVDTIPLIVRSVLHSNKIGFKLIVSPHSLRKQVR